jgi:hypothetical protein
MEEGSVMFGLEEPGIRRCGSESLILYQNILDPAPFPSPFAPFGRAGVFLAFKRLV